jgi:hypothetical protein
MGVLRRVCRSCSRCWNWFENSEILGEDGQRDSADHLRPLIVMLMLMVKGAVVLLRRHENLSCVHFAAD